MRSLGGIPVNRRERTNLVDQIVAKFDEYDDLIIGVGPSFTPSGDIQADFKIIREFYL